MKTKRRGHGEGSIFQRGDGRWTATISVGYDSNGKRKRRTIYGTTKREVQEKLARLQGQKLDGTLTDETRLTVADYMERWREDTARLSVAPSTLNRYRGLIQNHVNPHVGGVKLAKLNPTHIRGMYSAIERDGGSAGVREYVHAVLRCALNAAVRDGLILRNPCDPVKQPRAEGPEIHPLTAEQSQKLMQAAEAHRMHALFVLALTTGLRQGELFALHWADVDLEARTLHVRRSLEEVQGKLRLKEPKSRKGRRTVDLPDVAVSALWAHKARMLAEGLASMELVFCDGQGGLLRKSNFTRRDWKPLRDSAGIPPVRFHDLRHTHATLLLLQGVNPKIVQERLGHATISITLDTYSHVLPTMQREAVDRLDSLFAVASA